MVVKTDNAIYESFVLSDLVFKKLIKRTEKVIKNLKGFHRKALKPKLYIKFVSNNEIKGMGRCKWNNEIWINYFCKLLSKHSRYYCIPFVLLHELGHKYANCNKINFNYNDDKWITTPYSRISKSEFEKFAELFALSHFKYTGIPFDDYKKTIDRFIKLMS